jgi:hypothetical protein
VVRALFHAEPVAAEDLDRPIETELTRAARNSISNAGDILEADTEFGETDFADKKATKPKSTSTKRKQANKAERQRKAKARKRK